MTRKCMTLFISVLSVLALSVLGAVPAYAQSELEPGVGGAILKGEQTTTEKFAVGGRVYTCGVSKSEGTLAGKSSVITMTPAYESCDSEPVLGVSLKGTITGNGCVYVYRGAAKDAGPAYTFTTDIVCPAGKVIELHVYSNAAHTTKVCTITILPQNGKTQNTFTNSGFGGNGMDVIRHANLTLTAEAHGSPLFCGPETSAQNLTYTGTSTWRAYDPTLGTQVSLTAIP